MSNWKTYKLRNLVSFSQGIQIPLEEQFSIQHQDTGRFIRIVDYTNPNEEFRFIKNRDIKYWVNEKDIVMIRYGWAGKVVRGISGYIANNMFRIIVNNEQILNKEFLYYFLLQERIYKYLISCNSSTTMPSIKFGDFDNIDINLPSLEKQNTIVEKLNSFETKFKLNTQINQTLEQIAQAIFKSWFVDFDPVRTKAAALENGKTQAEAELATMQAISGKTAEELAQMPSESYAELAEIAKAFPSEFGEDGVPIGWGKTTLSEICEMQNGYAFKSSDWTENGTPVIKIGSVKPMIVEVEGNGFVSDEYQKLKPDFLLTNGDILVGLTGYVGEVGRIPQGKVAMLNQRVAKFIPKVIEENCSFYNYVYCLARQPQFKEFAEMNAKGSAQANISTKELLKFPIIKADNKLHILFENKIKSILEKILVNSQNSEDLARVRDLLLPKLLNGELNE